MSADESEDPADIQMKARILELFLPPFNKKIKEIAFLINHSRSFVYGKLQELVEEGKLEKLDSGHIKRVMPESQIEGYSDVVKSEFHKYKSIERWIYRMKRDKVKNWAYQVTDMYKICKTLQRIPDHFLAPLEQVEQLMEEFDDKFRKGEAFYIDEKNIKKLKSREDVSITHFIKAVRSFRLKLGHPIPKKLGGILTISEPTGQYARYKLTDSQRRKGINFMNNISNQQGDLFTFHHEVGIRTGTLFNAKPTFKQKILEVLDPKTNQNLVCEVYICEFLEQKTNQVYEKIVMTPEARRLVRRMIKGEKILNGKSDWKAKREYNKNLRRFYKEIELLSDEESPKKGTLDYYLTEYPAHFIRHSWSHWLMRCCGYNANVVAKFGWEDTETLTKVYSKQSIDDLLSIGNCNFCRPTSNRDPDSEIFCCLQHAIAYYNQQLPPELKN